MQVDRNIFLHSISVGILLILCISINVFMYNKLKNQNEKSQLLLLELYAQEIEKVVLNDFLKIFQHNYTTNDLLIIKNFNHEIGNQNITTLSHVVYVSSNTLCIKTSNQYLILDLLNIKRILDTISENLYLYSFGINNQQILTNTLVNLTDNRLLSTPINKDLLLTVSLKHRQDSRFIVLSDKILKTNILAVIYFSIAAFFTGIFIVFQFLNKGKKLKAEIDHKNSILLFIDKDKEFIAQCYEYSKKSKSIVQEEEEGYNNDYFPLSVFCNVENNKEVEICVDKITLAIKEYFCCYKKYHQLDNIELDIIHDNLNKMILPFGYEGFYQIMISIIYNLMNLNKKGLNKKGLNKRRIVVVLKQNKICIISDGLKLNREYAIKASATIFHDTANPYLMNFGQMFVLFNRHNITFDVSHENTNGTNITIFLPTKEKAQNTNFKVVKLNQYKRKKSHE